MYEDRAHAGKVLAGHLEKLREADPLVFGLPRGGVPVAYEVARFLQAPLDVVAVRKVGAPFNPELAIGAVAEGGAKYANADVLGHLRLTSDDFERLAERKGPDLERLIEQFRGGRPLPEVEGRVAIVVDDGLATGATAFAAVRLLRSRGARVIVAVPVGAPETIQRLSEEVDEIVCPEQPWDLMAVGAWYRDFGQTTDEEVKYLLQERASAKPPKEGGDRA